MSFLVFSSVFEIKVLFCAKVAKFMHSLSKGSSLYKGINMLQKVCTTGCTDYLCIIFTTINQHLCTINISPFVLPYIMTKDVIMSYNIPFLMMIYSWIEVRVKGGRLIHCLSHIA